MIRRALFITAFAVALSAAGAFAVAPSLARSPHRWGIGRLSLPGHTAVPSARDTAAVTYDPAATRAEGGTPGTYCPIRPRDSVEAAKRRAAEDLLGLSDGRARQSTPDSIGAMGS